MRWRLFFTTLAITALSVGATWLTLQPLLARAAKGADWHQASTLVLGLDLAVSALLGFLILNVFIGRASERTEAAALKRWSSELAMEREVNQRRLEELTRSNDALLRLQAELVAADRLATVGKLASGVAHEVGNPLSGILGYLSVLRMRAKDNAEVQDLSTRIENEVQRIDSIVRSLLELGRPSRGKAQPIDVRPVIDSCVKLLGAGKEFQNVRVKIEGPNALWLRAEPGPLSQVLVNLLINGAQAMDGKGDLTITLDEAGRVVVDDSGPGIPADVKARLFAPFFTTKPAGQGTGLGLAVSRHLLSQFDGTLDLADKPPPGARFIITLPVP